MCGCCIFISFYYFVLCRKQHNDRIKQLLLYDFWLIGRNMHKSLRRKRYSKSVGDHSQTKAAQGVVIEIKIESGIRNMLFVSCSCFDLIAVIDIVGRY